MLRSFQIMAILSWKYVEFLTFGPKNPRTHSTRFADSIEGICAANDCGAARRLPIHASAMFGVIWRCFEFG